MPNQKKRFEKSVFIEICSRKGFSLYNGIGWLSHETALSLATSEDAAVGVAVSAETNVSRLSPHVSPGVLDLPVISIGCVGSESNKKDTVIKVCSASAGQNTCGVKLESILVSFNSNRNWAFAKSGFKFILVLGADVNVAGDGVVKLRALGG